MEPELKGQIGNFWRGRAENRLRILPLLREVGEKGKNAGYFESYEVNNGIDIHGFYTLKPEIVRYPGILVAHVQGYPGMSDENAMRVSCRIRDKERMLKERETPGVSIGNEHAANVATLWGNCVHDAAYDSEVMLHELMEGLRGLKFQVI